MSKPLNQFSLELILYGYDPYHFTNTSAYMDVIFLKHRARISEEEKKPNVETDIYIYVFIINHHLLREEERAIISLGTQPTNQPQLPACM